MIPYTVSKLIQLPGGPHVKAHLISEVSSVTDFRDGMWIFHVYYTRNDVSVNFSAHITGTRESAEQTHYNLIKEINSAV